MTVSVGLIEFDEQLVTRQLKRDLSDDWFPDPLRFDDMFDGNHIKSILEDNVRRNHGIFRPSRRTLLNVPKPNYSLRYGLETSLSERALYHALVSRLVPYYDALIPWNVFSHRAAFPNNNRYLFRRAIPSWQDFVGVVRNNLSDSPVLLSTDLTNYFENISLAHLKTTLLDLLPEVQANATNKAVLRTHIETLFECLSSWCYSDANGLPQNRDASSFLSNVYMLPVDRAMLVEKKDKYFRYMDDIKVACEDVHDARRTLKHLSLELRKFGLSINSGKTAIVPASDAVELAKVLDTGEDDLQKIDSIWQTRSLRPISRSFPLLHNLTLQKLRNGEVSTRTFRYCIARLEMLARCPEFKVPTTYFASLTPFVISALPENPAATDELTRYLRAVPTNDTDLAAVARHLRDSNLNYYTWQCYRLWILLVQKSYRNADLLNFALGTIRTGDDDANRCGATLYAGAFGDDDNRVEIASRFHELDSFLGQRAAILAIQELHFRPHVKQYVAPVIRADLLNVYRNLQRRGIYAASPEPYPITRILDKDRDYE